MPTNSLAFRADFSFTEEVGKLAAALGLSRSDYLRQAVEEKNRRTVEERIKFLSQTLSAKSAAENQSMDSSVGDGLA